MSGTHVDRVATGPTGSCPSVGVPPEPGVCAVPLPGAAFPEPGETLVSTVGVLPSSIASICCCAFLNVGSVVTISTSFARAVFRSPARMAGLGLAVQRFKALVAIARDGLAHDLVLARLIGRHFHGVDGVCHDLTIGTDDALTGLDADGSVAAREQQDTGRQDGDQDKDGYRSA